MPAPQASVLKELMQVKFMSFGLKVPSGWQQPTGEAAEGWAQAYENATPVMPASPPLYLPASSNPTHVQIQKQMVADLLRLYRTLCDCICQAWQTWQTSAVLTGVMINGPVASLGNVVGPPWAPIITAFAQAQGLTESQMKYIRIIAKVLSESWEQYTMSIKVPALPWYPAFATMASPVAPPVPNIPVPVIALTSVPASMQTEFLKMRMVLELGDPRVPYHAQLFESIADGVNQAFTIWQTSTQVTNVIGTGPVPTFAPPVVPMGPVVAGVGTMTPGGFA